MKKLFPFLFVSILVLTSCNKDDGDDGGSVDVAPLAGTYTGTWEITQHDCFGDNSLLGQTFEGEYYLAAHNGGYKVGTISNDGIQSYDMNVSQDGEQLFTLNAAGSGSYSYSVTSGSSYTEYSYDINIIAGVLQSEFLQVTTEPTVGECIQRWEGTFTK